MGEKTQISWTRSTANCWHGCDKVDALCKHCYAEVSTPVRVKRAKGLEVWGPKAFRSETKSWASDVRKWNRAAAASCVFWPVFGQSLSDTFEDRNDACVVRADGSVATLNDLRADFFAAIEAAPALTFQLLTKRPENVNRMVPKAWLDKWPQHVWIGTSVGDQESAEKRVPRLLEVHGALRFLSVEPQLGPVDLTPWIGGLGCRWRHPVDARQPVAWVICGGESGSKARPFQLSWPRSLRDQCSNAGVAYFLKQFGAHIIDDTGGGWTRVFMTDDHGGDESEWRQEFRGCRAFPPC